MNMSIHTTSCLCMHHVIQSFSTLVEIIAGSELITNTSFDTNINLIYSYNF